MDIVYFTLTGAVLYLGSDWVLNRIEEARGARFPHRSLVFFAIILSASMLVFSCMAQLTNLDEQAAKQAPPVQAPIQAQDPVIQK